MPEQFYITDRNPSRPKEHLLLEDGSAVICATEDLVLALAVAAEHRTANVVRHSDLSDKDRRRVNQAFEKCHS